MTISTRLLRTLRQKIYKEQSSKSRILSQSSLLNSRDVNRQSPNLQPSPSGLRSSPTKRSLPRPLPRTLPFITRRSPRMLRQSKLTGPQPSTSNQDPQQVTSSSQVSVP